MQESALTLYTSYDPCHSYARLTHNSWHHKLGHA